MGRPQKITFAEMRSSGVRGLLIYCSIIAAATTSRSAVIVGRMMCGCLILSPDLFARGAASEAPTCGRISTGTGQLPSPGDIDLSQLD